MMEALRGWIINICTTVFFITAIEMLLPSNAFKKYSKFVLGLILMTVIINPLVKFINNGADISTFISKSASIMEQQTTIDNTEEYKQKSINDTLSVFKNNLEDLVKKKLNEKFKKGEYKVDAQVKYDEENQEYAIDTIKIAMNSGGVEKVKRIEIKTNSDVKSDDLEDSKYSKEVKSYLSSELDIPESKIVVYKLAQ